MLLWSVVAGIAAATLAYRIWTARSVRARPTGWWWSYSLTLAGIIAGAGFRIDQPAVNKTLNIPSVSYLLCHLGFILAAGAVNIYVSYLRSRHVTSSRLASQVGLAVGVAGVNLVAWIVAPVHSFSDTTFAQAPVTTAVIGYAMIFHLYFAATFANIAVAAHTVAQSGNHDPGRALGGKTIMASAILGVPTHVLYISQDTAQLAGYPATGWATIAGVCTLVCMAGIGAGSIIFLAVPRLDQYRRARQLCRELTPLWLRVRQLYPDVALPATQHLNRSRALHAERMLIELGDAWRLLHICPTQHARTPPEQVADQLIHPAAGQNAGMSAAQLLPTAHSRGEEVTTAVAVARAYQARSEPAGAS